MDATERGAELLSQGVRVWLDAESKLRIDTDVSPGMRQMVRENKTTITAVLNAQASLNTSGLRLVWSMGGYAIAKRPGELSPETRDALRLLGLDTLPLVHNTEGGLWLDYEIWRCWQVTARFDTLFDASDRQRWIEALYAERDEQLQARRRRRSA